MPYERHIDEQGYESIRFVPTPEQAAIRAEKERLEAEQAAARAERKRLQEARAAWRREQEERKAAGLEPSEPPPGLYAPRKQKKQRESQPRQPRAPREEGVNAWFAMPLEWRKEHGRRWTERRATEYEERTAAFWAEMNALNIKLFGRPIPAHPNTLRPPRRKELDDEELDDEQDSPAALP